VGPGLAFEDIKAPDIDVFFAARQAVKENDRKAALEIKASAAAGEQALATSFADQAALVQAKNEEPVPVEWAWLILRRARAERHCFRFVLQVAFASFFTAAFSMLRPVGPIFAVQDPLLELTARRPIPGSSGNPQGFYDITDEEAWYQWVELKLLPTILSEEYFNGDSRIDTWGQRWRNTVGMYNTLTTAVRFRQARVTDDSCGKPTSSPALDQPCWGDFSTDKQFTAEFGQEYGNRFLTGLEAFSRSGFTTYGTQGHVVDVPLAKTSALSILHRMKEGQWLGDGTRVMAVETSWYNANVDLSTYCRWQVDVSAGGRFTPSVSIQSCRLFPYATPTDIGRLVVELLFVLLLLYFTLDALQQMRSVRHSYFLSVWNWLELAHLSTYYFIVFWWVVYLLMDKKPFEKVNAAIDGSRPDLSLLTSHFNFMATIGGINVVFSYIKVLAELQMIDSVAVIWRSLKCAATDTWPLLLVFVLWTSGFAFAGHWMFGMSVQEFHSWPQSFATLLLTMVGGFPYNEIRRVGPVSAGIYTAVWVLLMILILTNMFVAVLVEWYRRIEEEHNHEEKILDKVVGEAVVRGRPFYSFVRLLLSPFQRGGRQVNAATMLVDSCAQEVSAALRRLDSRRNTEHVRQAVIARDMMVAEELQDNFGGDMNAAHEFVLGLQRLQEAEELRSAQHEVGGLRDRREDEFHQLREQEQLSKLQFTVEKLEENIRLIRSALRKSKEAPLKPGQAEAGFRVDALEGVPVDSMHGGQRMSASVSFAGMLPTPSQLPGALPGQY